MMMLTKGSAIAALYVMECHVKSIGSRPRVEEAYTYWPTGYLLFILGET
jgi:hypothetical protein